MRYINRAVAVIKPRQPFVDWINQLPDYDETLSLRDLRATQDFTAYLIPEYEMPDEAYEYIKGMYETIFKRELEGWYRDSKFWPKKRDYETFLEWFVVELHSEVIDTIDSRITKSKM